MGDIDNVKVGEDLVDSEELLKGKRMVPLGQIFPFLFEYISENFERQLGVSSPLDRNFLFLQQMITREKISKIEAYQCLQPLLNSVVDKKHLTITAIQRHETILDIDQTSKPQKSFSLFYLIPSPAETPQEPFDLLWLHTLYQNKLREKLPLSFNFSHILKAIAQCIKDNHFFFNLVEETEEKNNWTFQYDNGHIFIYYVPNIAPQPHLEKTTLCRWISVVEPIYERNISSSYHCFLDEATRKEILNDKESEIDTEEKEEECTTCSA